MDLFANLQAEVGQTLRNGGEQATAYAEKIIGRLDVIAEGILSLQNPAKERTTASDYIEANSQETLVEGRAGYMLVIEHVSIVAEGATDIDIFVGSVSDTGFRLRYSFAQAGRDQDGPMELEIPPNSTIYATTGDFAATVNLQIQRKAVA